MKSSFWSDPAFKRGYDAGYAAGRKMRAEQRGAGQFSHCWGCVQHSVCPFQSQCSRWSVAHEIAPGRFHGEAVPGDTP